MSYYFPPLGMGGIQRVASLCTHLTRLGWEITVLTVRPFGYPAYDYSLAERLPPSIRIHRAVPFEQIIMRRHASAAGKLKAQSGYGAGLSCLARWAMLPDSKTLTAFGMLRRIAPIVERVRPAAVVTSSPPPSIHLVGLHLRKYFGVKWIADFRDVWFSQSRVPYRTSLHRTVHRGLERAFVENADMTVVVSDGHLELLRIRYEKAADRLRLIPNGYEEDAFADTVRYSGNGAAFHLGYCGTLNHLTHVPGMLETLIDISLTHPVSLDICGFVSPELRALIDRLDPEGHVIHLHGYQDHGEAVKFKMRCDANLVTLAPDSHLELTVPGKAYEALRAQKPVIGVVSDGCSAWRLLAQFDDVVLVDPSDMTELKRKIIRLIESGPSDVAIRTGIDRFAWGNLMAQYDHLLREISAC